MPSGAFSVREKLATPVASVVLVAPDGDRRRRLAVGVPSASRTVAVRVKGLPAMAVGGAEREMEGAWTVTVTPVAGPIGTAEVEVGGVGSARRGHSRCVRRWRRRWRRWWRA